LVDDLEGSARRFAGGQLRVEATETRAVCAAMAWREDGRADTPEHSADPFTTSADVRRALLSTPPVIAAAVEIVRERRRAPR
jgi:hypothetical protein